MKKVLVVEDDVFLANAYRVKLVKAGFDISLVQDGGQVLAGLSSFQPDVIILDLMLPNKDGFEILKEIKSLPQWQQIPILVASNLGQDEDIQKALSLGAKDYIIKSDFSLNDVIAKIHAASPPA